MSEERGWSQDQWEEIAFRCAMGTANTKELRDDLGLDFPTARALVSLLVYGWTEDNVMAAARGLVRERSSAESVPFWFVEEMEEINQTIDAEQTRMDLALERLELERSVQRSEDTGTDARLVSWPDHTLTFDGGGRWVIEPDFTLLGPVGSKLAELGLPATAQGIMDLVTARQRSDTQWGWDMEHSDGGITIRSTLLGVLVEGQGRTIPEAYAALMIDEDRVSKVLKKTAQAIGSAFEEAKGE